MPTQSTDQPSPQSPQAPVKPTEADERRRAVQAYIDDQRKLLERLRRRILN